MPITEELKNVKRFETVGFSHEQAEALAETFEQTQVNGQEGLKDFIRGEFEKFDKKFSGELEKFDKKFSGEFEKFDKKFSSELSNLRNELKQDIKDLEIRIAYSQKDLLIKIFGIIFGVVGMAVTVLKLFP